MDQILSIFGRPAPRFYFNFGAKGATLRYTMFFV